MLKQNKFKIYIPFRLQEITSTTSGAEDERSKVTGGPPGLPEMERELATTLSFVRRQERQRKRVNYYFIISSLFGNEAFSEIAILTTVL